MEEKIERYRKGLSSEIDRIYEIARRARKRNLDPDGEVEAIPAGDLAARVEGLVGPPGIAAKIREHGRGNLSKIIDSMLDLNSTLPFASREAEIEQALRTSLAIITEGVVAAPIEGISDVKVKRNPDGSEYLSIFFAGPIRSAGGTAQGQAVLVGDYIRGKIGLKEFRPTGDEVERYIEEIKLYHERAARLQYQPSDDDIREIVRRVPVCVDGDPTEDTEVAIHRDLERIPSNRIRGGMCLVIAEGIAQKSRKVMGYAKNNLSLDWDWLSGLGHSAAKPGDASENEEDEADENDLRHAAKFMGEVVGGRPIFAGPSAKGAFRLRYGRSRTSGIAAKCLHPATMILLDDFIATGTQVKVERPGKGCVMSECDEIEGPRVLLKDGSVELVETRERAYQVRENLKEILFLGDILISYGDFLQTNTPLLPAGYCEDWWQQEAKNTGAGNLRPNAREAVEVSLSFGIPLHPKYTFAWEDASPAEIRTLVDWLSTGGFHEGAWTLENNNAQAKRTLEILGAPHRVADGRVVIHEHEPLLAQLGSGNETFDRTRFDEAYATITGDPFELIAKASKVKLRRKVGTYIGGRMGRPEKAKERKMQPPVHALFPIGNAGGRNRSINEAAEKNRITIDASTMVCDKCNIRTISSACPICGGRATLLKTCPSCNIVTQKDACPRCKAPAKFFGKADIEMGAIWKAAVEKIGRTAEVKGVIGMISEYKIPEPLEKGLLRAIHNVFVFKDGTTRFDATDVPLTHFRPREVGVSIERLKALGYSEDYLGRDLTSEDQILELRIQDVVIPASGAEYLIRVTQFVDELLAKLYGMERFYKVGAREDLLGHLIVGLAPHTSAGIVGRIVGFTKASVCYAHPFWHAAKRRNCDGDEDAFMLLLDALLNFSRKYLPEKRGGKMDAPLVISTLLDPKEIDDEAHKMEIIYQYPLEFYEKTWLNANPGDVDLRIVKSILNTNPHSDFRFTHGTSDINGPVLRSRYVTLTTMKEKIDAQLKVAEKIRAIDEREVAELVINSHFLRDTYGNLRAFAKQHFRCVNCNENYRRVPLAGKCTKCGGKLILTVSEGNILKYLDTSLELAEKYHLSDYLKMRLNLVKTEVNSLFTNELKKQVSLSDFM